MQPCFDKVKYIHVKHILEPINILRFNVFLRSFPFVFLLIPFRFPFYVLVKPTCHSRKICCFYWLVHIFSKFNSKCFYTFRKQLIFMTIWQAAIVIISRLNYYNYQFIYHMEVIYKKWYSFGIYCFNWHSGT